MEVWILQVSDLLLVYDALTQGLHRTPFSTLTNRKGSNTSSMSKHLIRQHKNKILKSRGGLLEDTDQTTLDPHIEHAIPVSLCFLMQTVKLIASFL